MGFQHLFDNAQTLKITKRPVVAQTTTRSGVVRSVSRGNAVWRFEVAMPEGVKWQDFRYDLATIDKLDRFTSEAIDFSNTGFAWMFPYQGDEPNIANVRLNVLTAGDRLGIATGVTITSGYIFKAGDIIELVGGRAYEVAADTAWDATEVVIHRPWVDETIGTYDIRVGPNARHTVVCVSMPNWYFIDQNQISWDGVYVFQEVI